jgi:hypothetical protein
MRVKWEITQSQSLRVCVCNDFELWAKESNLRDIPDDYGWNEISAFTAERFFDTSIILLFLPTAKSIFNGGGVLLAIIKT